PPPAPAAAAAAVPGAVAEHAPGSLADGLAAADWDDADAALTVYAHGVAMLANCPGSMDAAAQRARLIELEGVVQTRFAGFSLSRRGPM
ncbi:MAG: hypothetical protein R3286_16100, partial [Gammaproteobacteria bacterium]|nr:hypothetical protein [Gammaproteobacteria bacterium]